MTYILLYYDIPDKIQRMVKLLYVTFESAVFDEWNKSEWFGITTEVKQGCVMLGFLFLLSTTSMEH
jgi:hypothetical protein